MSFPGALENGAKLPMPSALNHCKAPIAVTPRACLSASFSA